MLFYKDNEAARVKREKTNSLGERGGERERESYKMWQINETQQKVQRERGKERERDKRGTGKRVKVAEGKRR